jgi:uncharacterized SAM-binding protein YcdF (DUF218 family)
MRRLRGDVSVKVKRGCAIAVLLIAALMVGASFLPQSLLLSGLTVHTPLARSDAIVLVGGGFKERAPAAATLYRDGYAPLVILANDGVFSAWSTIYNRNLYQVEWAEEELITLGVPRERIVKLPFYGSATMLDALAVKQFLFKSGLKRIIVVTSDYHTRRALWSFRHALKEYTADITVFPARSFGVGVKRLAVEYVKCGYYLVRYGMPGMMPEANERPLQNH